MKSIRLLITIAYMAFIVSCGNSGSDDHSHEEDAAHVHESETVATHTHEGETEATETLEGEADATHTHEGEADASHTHEQDVSPDQQQTAGTIARKTETIHKQNFRFIRKTSGQIMVDKKDEVIITAKNSGIVRFKDHFLYPGLKMSAGESLFTISGENLTENNTTINFARVEADYDRAKSNFDRATSLIDDQLITEEHYLEAKNEYLKAEAEYKVYKSSSSRNHSVVESPQACFLKEVYVKEGEKVMAGDRLASILIEHNMVLRADISPSDFESIQQIESAKFSTGYSNTVFNTEKMNGSKISYGKSSGENSYYIPVYFRIDFNNELIPGTFADIWLRGNEIEDVIVIPNSAIMEEYGKFYVFIDHDDHFDKRFITLGNSDGDHTHILAGLNESESIVVEGTYQVKMSLMTSIPNTHDHSH